MDNQAAYRALLAAANMVTLLPVGAVWSVCLTDEDDPQSPGVFNIFVPDTAARHLMRNMCGFMHPDDEAATYESYKFQDTLLVSIIEPPRADPDGE
jgi:hypothetical protein